MLQLNVSQLLQASIGSTRNYKVDGIVDISAEISGGAVRGEVSLMHTDRSILVKGTLYTEPEITCSRCLGSFKCSLTLDVEEEYFPMVDVASGAFISLPDKADVFTIDEHHLLNLSEAVRQYVLMAIPMKPLCRENCAGLCSSCGYNLNQGTCDCTPKEIDPRWSELQKLASGNR